MGTSIYRFSDVEAKTAKPDTIKDAIKTVLRANDDACYIDAERFLTPPGVTGSRSFDQGRAVGVLLDHDHDIAVAESARLQKVDLDALSHEKYEEFSAKVVGRIAAIMLVTGMGERLLWDKLQAVLKQTGFKFKHGRLVGLLEHQEEETNGDPDID